MAWIKRDGDGNITSRANRRDAEHVELLDNDHADLETFRNRVENRVIRGTIKSLKHLRIYFTLMGVGERPVIDFIKGGHTNANELTGAQFAAFLAEIGVKMPEIRAAIDAHETWTPIEKAHATARIARDEWFSQTDPLVIFIIGLSSNTTAEIEAAWTLAFGLT